MIIFDLDGTLANCEHRRHFVDPKKNSEYSFMKGDMMTRMSDGYFKKREGTSGYTKFKPHWKAFYEACDKDTPIDPVVWTMRRMSQHDEVQIWSGRCESVRDKTTHWLYHKIPCFCPMSWFDKNLKMRPVGDSTPDDQLKEKWLDDHIAGGGKPIDFIFDDRPKVVRMYRRRGIFVFDCNQTGEEF
jgi:hypothetical protein